MYDLSSIHDIPLFRRDVRVYIDGGLKGKLMKFSGQDTFGFLIGDVLSYRGQEYVVITDIVRNIDELDEKIGEFEIVVGSFFQGGDIEELIEELPYGLTNKKYYTAIIYNAASDYDDIFFEVYRKFKKGSSINYYKTRFKFVSLPIGGDLMEEKLHINKELSTFREAERLLRYISLSIFAAIFGVFGGIIGYILSKNQTKSRRLILVVIGIISTIVWLILPYFL